MTELTNIFKTMPAYLMSLFENHMIVMVIVAVVFLYVTLFSGKVAGKIRSVFVLASLLMIVFSFISQSWPRIALICTGLVIMFGCRIVGYAINEIRIMRRNKRLEERALEKAAKRRGSWQNKQGYSGARKPIIEPEYVPEAMNSEEIADVIENEFADPIAPVSNTTDVVVDEFTDAEDSDWSEFESETLEDSDAIEDIGTSDADIDLTEE